jgi:hypothetical protein
MLASILYFVYYVYLPFIPYSLALFFFLHVAIRASILIGSLRDDFILLARLAYFSSRAYLL